MTQKREVPGGGCNWRISFLFILETKELILEEKEVLNKNVQSFQKRTIQTMLRSIGGSSSHPKEKFLIGNLIYDLFADLLLFDYSVTLIFNRYNTVLNTNYSKKLTVAQVKKNRNFSNFC